MGCFQLDLYTVEGSSDCGMWLTSVFNKPHRGCKGTGGLEDGLHSFRWREKQLLRNILVLLGLFDAATCKITSQFFFASCCSTFAEGDYNVVISASIASEMPNSVWGCYRTNPCTLVR